MTNLQMLQTAINGVGNTHTALHQAIQELRHGSVNEGKELLTQQIVVLANVLIVL
jgi:hypothetical protein